MHSTIQLNTSLPRAQEIRIQEILDRTPRFAPWGTKNWAAPKGFVWTTVDSKPLPESVLADEETHQAVAIVGHYSFPVHIDDDVIVMARTNDCVPALYIIRVETLRESNEVVHLTKFGGHCLFPFVNREEILALCPNLPQIIASHYVVEGKVFVWTWKPHQGVYRNEELDWFNNSTTNSKFESIELVRVDHSTGLIIGSGTGVPAFVLSQDLKKLIAFIQKYDEDSVNASSQKLVTTWRERFIRNIAKENAYVG